MRDQVRQLRTRLADAAAAADAAAGGAGPLGTAARLAQTVGGPDYPTDAAAAYSVALCDIDCQETEGAAATYVPQPGGATCIAFNLGSLVPPPGTMAVIHAVGGRWCFRYDG